MYVFGLGQEVWGWMGEMIGFGLYKSCMDRGSVSVLRRC